MVASRVRVLIGLLALATPPHIYSSEDDSVLFDNIKHTLQSRFPDGTFVEVRSSPIVGLYEVFTGEEVVYVDRSANFLLTGSLIDTRTHQNLTSERIDALSPIDFKTLPFNLAIQTVRGRGDRQIAVFTDPDCPFCEQQEQELAQLDNVKIYTFLYPLPSHPQAPAKARAIWCSQDRSRAWQEWMLNKKDPGKATCTQDPIEELRELGQKLHIRATPTLILPNGRKIRGGLAATELDRLLLSSATTP